MAGDLTFVVGDATAPRGDCTKIIAHVCNDAGAWGRGFVLAVSRRWPEPEQRYRRAHRERRHFGLGWVELVGVAPGLFVSNMIAQHGIRTSADGVPPIRYDALAECLATVADQANDLKASVHMPRIGCGLAGGKWRLVEPLVRRWLCDQGIDVTVYDLAEDDHADD